MKRLLLLLTALSVLNAHAQLLSWTPPFPKEADPSQTLEITVDATKGNKGLQGYTPATDVYVHIGVITNLSTSASNWRHVPFTWGTTTPNAAAVSLGNNKWKFTITGSLRTFFGLTNGGETIQKIAILFRSGNGNRKQANADGSDMYIPVYGNNLAVRIDEPAREPKFMPVAEPQSLAVGASLPVTAHASKPSTIKLYHNSTTPFKTATGVQTLSGTSTITAIGSQQLIAEANDGTTTTYDTLQVFVAPPASPVAALPPGVRDGINYEPGDTSVTLVLRAPGKNIVSVIGEFNNWTQSASHIMNKTPDGKFFWIRIQKLTPGVEYAYQYIVDNSIRIADPYTEKVLDPWNDPFISPATYPNLKPYPAGQSGIVSVLQTAAPKYTFTASNYVRPDKKGLVAYELLVRDFVAAHDWKTVQDSLRYLKSLGINAIELLPFNEFEGNESWGYNPSFYFAPDKYYGPPHTLKRFIDSCHKAGIAVIMDIALNHSFGQSPMVQLYWDAANNRPSSDNPWYNPVARHPFNVGYDMNHESLDTRYFTSRVVEHWLTEYKIDGFRFDLSKGFTQTNSGDNVSMWGNYDASRIAIWKRYYDTLQLKAPGSYAILEHFADNGEEKELSDYGLMFWGNMSHAYQEAAMGYLPGSNMEGALHSARGWTNPFLMSYAESHDEERIVYKTLNFGNAGGNYTTRDLTTALKRMELDAAFLFGLPGPKMLWQFGELGYDFSINHCPNGTVNENCRTSNKPIRWDYLNDARRQSVYNTYSKLINLRFHPLFKRAFESGTTERSLAGAVKWIKLTTDTSRLVVIGNFDVTSQAGTITFPSAGTWYDYLNKTTFTATGSGQTLTLAPGEFFVFENRNVNNLTTTAVPVIPVAGNVMEATIFPNPAKGDVTVELYVPQSAPTRFEIVASTGQIIGPVRQHFLTKGKHQVTLNRHGIPAGTYYLRITNKANTKITPLIFQ